MNTPSHTETDELRGLVLEILADAAATHRPDAGQAAWSALAASDLTLVGVDEELGGSGGTLAEAATVLSATASAGYSLPIVETAWLAGWLATASGRPAPAGAVTVVIGDCLIVEPAPDGTRVSGTLFDVAWRHAVATAYVVLPTTGQVAVVPLGTTQPDAALGLPTADIDLDLVVDPGDLFDLPGEVDAVLAELDLRRALGRTVQIGGACSAVLATAVRYATERVQFGRSLSRYQVIQHYLARVASRTHGVTVASATAVAAFAADGPAAATAVQAAKCVASEAVEEVTQLVHQVLGAIGTTREHPLHRCTMSMWEWRDDAGDEYARAREIATSALDGDGDVWAFLAPVDVTIGTAR